MGGGGGVYVSGEEDVALGHSVGMRVVLVEPADPVQLIVDVAGDVLDVLHVGSERHRDRLRERICTDTDRHAFDPS